MNSIKEELAYVDFFVIMGAAVMMGLCGKGAAEVSNLSEWSCLPFFCMTGGLISLAIGWIWVDRQH